MIPKKGWIENAKTTSSHQGVHLNASNIGWKKLLKGKLERTVRRMALINAPSMQRGRTRVFQVKTRLLWIVGVEAV